MINYFSKHKSIFYFFNFILIILYLFPGSLIDKLLFNDTISHTQLITQFKFSVYHFYAFFFLSIVGFFTYKRSNDLNILIIYLIILSSILELFHLIIPGRLFESADIFGNLIGISMLKIIDYLFSKYEKFKN